MLKLDWNLLWTVINILVLFLLLRKFLFNPVCKIIDERTAAIQKDLDSAKAKKQEAEQMKADYEAGIKNARQEAAEITNTAKANANKECELMLENARAESARIIKEAEKAAENEKSKAIDDVKYQIADLAILAAAKVIGKNVDNDTDREAANAFLSEVGASK
ncbi:MAG: F0F1 ATP synthase subunit B [Hominimerdicola sp.]